MRVQGNRVHKPGKGYGGSGHAPRRGGGRGSSSSRQARPRGEFPRWEDEVTVEAVDVKDKYSVFTFNLKDMGRRPTLDEGKMRAVAVDIGIEIKGRVKAIPAHARLPVNFESALWVRQPVQILDTEDSVVDVALYRGMREGDIEEFRDFPEGDNTVNWNMANRKKKVYTKGDRRHSVHLYGSKSLHSIRIWATGLGNLQDKQGNYCAVIAFKNEPGASLRVTSMKCSGFVKSESE